MWKKEQKSSVLELRPDTKVASVKPVDVRYVELPGSGAGDQLIFQGRFKLGEGPLRYNLTIFSFNFGEARWSVRDINSMRRLPESVKKRGKKLALNGQEQRKSK